MNSRVQRISLSDTPAGNGGVRAVVESRETEGREGVGDPFDTRSLFSRFLAGDNEAFLVFFREHDRMLRLYCRRVLGDEAGADDVVQETWMRVIGMRGSEREIDRPLGLLYRIARNLCIDTLRRARRTVSIDEMPEGIEVAERGGSDMEETVLEALDALPFEAREVLVLHHYCGYRFDEIATMLERTPEAIWARASRARKQLRTIIAGAMAEGSSSAPSETHTLRTSAGNDHEHKN